MMSRLVATWAALAVAVGLVAGLAACAHGAPAAKETRPIGFVLNAAQRFPFHADHMRRPGADILGRTRTPRREKRAPGRHEFRADK